MTHRRTLSVAARVLVSGLLVGLLLSRLDLGDMGRFVMEARYGLVLLTLLAVLVDRCLVAGRWIALLEGLGVRASRWALVKIFFLSTFFGSFLPSGVGGSAVAAYSSSRLTRKGVESVASVAMDRLLGMLSMLLTGLVSLVLFYRVFPHPALMVIVVTLSVLLVTGLFFLLSRTLHLRLQSSLKLKDETSGFKATIARGLVALGRYRSRLGLLGFVLALSLLVQVLRVFQAYFLSEAMGLSTPLLYFFCFIPLILVVTMLPISVSGWGTTNLAYVALFSEVGMDPDGAFVLSAMILALGILGNLPGGFLYALSGFSASAGSSPSLGRVEKPDRPHGNFERGPLVESEC